MTDAAESRKKEIVRLLLDRGLLVSTDLVDKLMNEKDLERALSKTSDGGRDVLLLSQDTNGLDTKKDINWIELDKARVLKEKKITSKSYQSFIELLKKDEPQQAKGTVDVTFNYRDVPCKKEVQDFVGVFNQRYKQLEKILSQRQELQGLTSINKILHKKDRETVAIIGMVEDKQYTKNNNLLLTLEDPTGSIKVIINKTKPDLFEEAKNVVLDEVIGVLGANADNAIFANSIMFPDVPLTKELKKGPVEEYAVFLSDLHVGSDNFLREELERFLAWINQETGTAEQREIASKVRYIFIVGDLVDGVGVYPSQENELLIHDIKEQYSECAALLARIPTHIPLVVCPGNHDSIRISEPQPPMYKDIAEGLWGLPNIHILSNPARVTISKSDGFPGFDVLLYHGYGFDYYIANVDEIRTKGGYDRADLVMSFLLRKRHLAPTHTSTLYVPDPTQDPLVIESVPDFFVTGHIHKASVSNYRGVTLICGSCWQAKTSFQEKVGHHPEPARVPIVNLATREVKILKFGGDDRADKP